MPFAAMIGREKESSCQYEFLATHRVIQPTGLSTPNKVVGPHRVIHPTVSFPRTTIRKREPLFCGSPNPPTHNVIPAQAGIHAEGH